MVIIHKYACMNAMIGNVTDTRLIIHQISRDDVGLAVLQVLAIFVEHLRMLWSQCECMLE